MIPVLDQGHVRLVKHDGSEEDIIRAARQSTSGAFKGWGPFPCPECVEVGKPSKEEYQGPGSLTAPEYVNVCKRCKGEGTIAGDEGLLRRLYKDHHMSPFEMLDATFEIKAPIFVFREWHRHRTQSYNEMSGRYVVLPDEYYMPSVERLSIAKQSATNKQGGGEGLTSAEIVVIQSAMSAAYKNSREFYDGLISLGVERGVARSVLPVAQYSQMWAKANLRNWLQFLTLRNDSAAQWEIRQYAIAVEKILADLFPNTMALYKEGRS